MDLDKFLEELKMAGKIQKFSLYTQIIKLVSNSPEFDAYLYFNKFLSHLQEYLDYDNKPAPDIKKDIAVCFKFIFSKIRYDHDPDKFYEYLAVFHKFEQLIEEPEELAEIFQDLGYLFWLANDLDSSKKFLQQSLELINLTESKAIPGRFTNLGYVYEFTGDFDTAEDYYLQGIKFAEHSHSQEAMFLAYNALGRLNFNLELYQKAQNYFQAALDLHDKDTFNSSHIPTIMNLASTFVFLKQYDQAVKCLKEIQNDWLKKDDPDLYYSSFINLAIYYLKMGNLNEAQKSNDKVREYAQKNNNLDLLFGYYYNLSKIQQKLNNLDSAILFAEKALQISRSADNQRQLSKVLNNLAVFHMDSQNYDKALILLKEAEASARNQNNDGEMLTVLLNKTECYSALKNYKKAFSSQNEYIKLSQKIQKKKDKEELLLKNQHSVKASKASHLIFNTGYTLISKELSQYIGIPIIGQSMQIQKVIQQAILIASNNDASVLLRGESGTGKELIARLIHFTSDRKKAPFIPVNSASVTNGLAQSTLFGHEKGAFTGAVNMHQGLFEQAHKGTIFLDEIADMPSDIQAYLLRILEDKKIRRLGSSNDVNSDFRLISATNSNIEDMVKKDLFRLDLLNRINTLEIVIPPLRERIDDIPLFLDYYLKEISRKLNRKTPLIEAAVIDILLSYNYPGNVREFINIIEKLIIFCKNDIITENDLCFLKLDNFNFTEDNETQNLNLQDNEYRLIMIAMKKCNFVQAQAAKLLGIPYYTLSRKLKKMSEKNSSSLL
jgi:transcriptional regulator with PAS, ATPase and Fis domain/uncharacterized protein HemY